ncbi:hypothetical protein JQ617_37960 [Bradyrhizobium sp. KB893862 SZCCT0404]|uniref:hypothetical protein n=1 Tax=Bradyrhizobium sp. KB893862 SZCCT0404 TaxID=2807672 RepID=UPI001BABD15E|nr:hypothetical protein [Bradyrhizobium sp. KB893862 SZCCT0404]MBR1179804.1 hypothetical protein [Bradyrhizobium sp. KB893862 SZCCT0404]
MDTNADKLKTVSEAIEGILRQTSAPTTYFDEDPTDGALPDEPSSHGVLSRSASSESSFGSVGQDAHGLAAVGSERNESIESIRRTLTEQADLARSKTSGRQLFAKTSPELPAPQVDTHTASKHVPRSTGAETGVSVGKRVLWSVALFVLGAAVSAAVLVWRGSLNGAGTPGSEPTSAALAAPAALPADLKPLLQSMSIDIAALRKDIEQLRLRDTTVRDSATSGEQLKASLDPLARAVARLSDQVKASQELTERDNAIAAEQIRAVREQLIRLEQNAVSKRVPPPPRTTTAPAAPKPAPAASSQQAASQPGAVKPKPAPSAPASAPAPAR